MERLNERERKLLKYLNAQEEPMSTYMITKDTGIPWTTVYTNCGNLLRLRLVDTKYIEVAVTSRSKQVWFISRAGEEFMVKYCQNII